MSSGSLAPFLKQSYFDSNGNPLSGGKLYAYQAGTSTPQATYTDSSLGTPNANPVILDSSGRASVWLDQSLSYKFVLKDSSDVVQWTMDGVIGLLTADAVPTAALQALCVTTAKLALDSVDSTILKDDAAVDGNRAVTTNHIRDSAITTAKIADANVTTAKLLPTITSKTANYIILASDDTVTGDSSGGTFTLTLPAASARKSLLILRKTDSSFTAITVARAGSDTIDGATSTTLNTQYETLTLISDGVSKWFIVHRDYPRVWTSYTPTTQGFGTISSANFFWRRVGDSIDIKAKWTNGTVAASEAQVGFPSGLTASSTKIPEIMIVGDFKRGNAPGSTFDSAVYCEPSVGYVTMGPANTSGEAGFTKKNGNQIFNNSEVIGLWANGIAISGWN